MSWNILCARLILLLTKELRVFTIWLMTSFPTWHFTLVIWHEFCKGFKAARWRFKSNFSHFRRFCRFSVWLILISRIENWENRRKLENGFLSAIYRNFPNFLLKLKKPLKIQLVLAPFNSSSSFTLELCESRAQVTFVWLLRAKVMWCFTCVLLRGPSRTDDDPPTSFLSTRQVALESKDKFPLLIDGHF